MYTRRTAFNSQTHVFTRVTTVTPGAAYSMPCSSA
jgi:hypothetical protein